MGDLTAVSLFAGIGGFDLALKRAGVSVTAAVEIDPDCRGVLRRHFPQAKVFNDVTEVTGEQLRAAGFVPGRGIITGGFPCQDLSVAGRRAGMGGARSGLFWEIVRLADELRPRWLLLENVPGLLSAVCPCPGDEACVANGRSVRCGRWDKRDGRRVFIPRVTHTPSGGACAGGCMAVHGGAMGTVLGAVGKLGYGFAYRVLDAQHFGVPQRRRRVFIAGCLGDPAGPVEVLLEPQGGDGDLAEGRAARAGTSSGAGGHPAIPRVAGALTAGCLDGHDDNTAQAGHLIAHTLTARERKGADSDAVSGFVMTAVTLQGGGRRGHRIDAEGAAGGHLVAATLTSGHATGDGVRPPGRRAEDDVNLIAHALTSEGADASEDGTGDFSSSEDIAQTARSAHGQPGTISDATAVRRLTPRECERLQGFPDDWTRWLDDGTEQSDSARYRQCGNAVAVPVAEWIARRVAAVDRVSAEEAAA